jgi:excinuclease ABC subunit C
MLQRIRDEAHRFAIKHSTDSKRKTLTRSSLEKIEGIGPKKAKALLSAMPLGKIRTSTKDELSAVKGISERDAENIYAYYHKR